MSLARNAVLNVVTQAVALVPAVLSMVVAHVLGPHDTGVYSFLAFLVFAAATVSTLGVPSAVTRYVALWSGAGRPEDATALVRKLLAGTALASLGVGVVLVAISIAGPLQRYGTGRVVLVACWAAAQVIAQTGAAGLAGLERFGSLLKVTIGAAALNVAGTVCALVVSPTVTALMWASTAAAAGSAALVLWPLRHGLLRGRALDAPDRADIWRYVLPLSAIVLLDGIVWQRSEVFFLGHYSSAQQIAFYALVFTLVSRFATLLPSAVSTVLLPRLASEFGRTGRTDATSYDRGIRGVVLLSVPLLCVGFVLAGPIVRVFYGQSYGPAIPVLRILLGGGVIGALAGVSSAAIYSAGRQTFILCLSVVVAAGNIGLDLLLIPQWAARGAAWANVAAQTLSGIATLGYAARRLGLAIPWAHITKVAGASVLASGGAALWLLGSLPSAVQLTGGAVTFVTVLLVLTVRGPVLSPQDRSTIRAALTRQQPGPTS